MRYEAFEEAEPTLLAGLVSSLVGFVALLAADFSALEAAATASGMGISQALLTRPFVFSPKSIHMLEASRDPTSQLSGVLRTGAGLPDPREPAVTVGVLIALGSALVQFFSGVDLATAFASAAGIGGVQTTATRARVYSPVSARQIGAEQLLAPLASPGDDRSAARLVS